MKTQYPWQIGSIVHKSKTAIRTLGMEANLFSPKEEDAFREPSAPLEMHENYSVFRGTLILKEGEEKKYVRFNIPAKAVPYIHKKTELVIQQNFLAETLGAKILKNMNGMFNNFTQIVQDFIRESICNVLGGLKTVFPGIPDITMDASSTKKKKLPKSTSGPAYTVEMKSGKLKGKTPAAALNEDSKNYDILVGQKDWLEKNLSKYPANKQQIDAIVEALELFEAGEIGDEAVADTETASYSVYEAPCKNIKPLDEEGRYTIYQVSVKYITGNNLPFKIEVMNCFAPVDTKKGNEIVMSEAVKKKTISMALSEDEWYTLIESMLTQKKMFEAMTYPEQLKLAEKISKESRPV